MIEVRQTEVFAEWLSALRDVKGRAVIGGRLARMAGGNFGDSKSVGERVSELRIDFGPGYRVYYTRQGETVVIVLAGGDKDTQARDIKAAQQMVKELDE